MRRTIGLTIAAGLLSLWPAGAARAQVSYGYDALVGGYQPSMTYYYSSGYDRIYTDPSLGAYQAGNGAPSRVTAPYQPPPFGTFGGSNAMGTYGNPGAAVVSPTTARPAVNPRRPLRRLFRGRR